MIRTVMAGLFVTAMILSPACKKESNVYFGLLEGTVTLEPLCPEPPCDLTPSELSEIWGHRQILIYTPDTSKVVSRITLTPDAGYSVALEEGDYIVDINYFEEDISPSVPATVTVASGFTAVLDIDIDTNLK
jgi:hypothetical protein